MVNFSVLEKTLEVGLGTANSLNIDQSMWGWYLSGLSTFDTYDTRNSFEALSANFGNLMSISQVDSLSYSGRED